MNRSQAISGTGSETGSIHDCIAGLHKLSAATLMVWLSLMVPATLIYSPSAIAAPSACTLPCQIQTDPAQTDYEHPDTALTFSRTRLSVPATTGTPNVMASNQHWRHRYEIVLTQQGDSRVVFDQHGNRHLFHPHGDGSYRPESSTGGELQLSGNQYRWISSEGLVHDFRGSYLSQLTIPDQRTGLPQLLDLQYDDHNRLIAIADTDGNEITLSYPEPGNVNVTTPDGDTLTYSIAQCAEPPVHTEPATCDVEANPLPSMPVVQVNIRHSGTTTTHVDARPASCESYFTDYFGTERGTRIETALEMLAPYRTLTSTVRSFPIVDFIDGSDLIVVRSRDLASPSFNNPDDPTALLDRLRRDGREIQRRLLGPLGAIGQISHTEQGQTTTIVKSPGQNVVLQLVIQNQIASPLHWQQIQQARTELLSRLNIELQVVLIP